MSSSPSRTLDFKRKLLLSLLAVGLLPLAIIDVVAMRAVARLGHDIEMTHESTSRGAIDMIDRNLFERYGDVQAFALNPSVRDTAHWYKPGADQNPIVAAMNGYVALYGLYDLTLAVDLDGRVIAVNDRNPAGQPLDTAPLYARNFKDAPWFQSTLQGQFLKSATLNGTVVTPPWFDDDVARLTRGDGMVLGFSAPIRDPAGRIVGVWHNRASFSFVEEIVQSAQQGLDARGFHTADARLVDGQGLILAHYDPVASGNKAFRRDRAVVLKANVLASGGDFARRIAAGESGVAHFVPPGETEDHVSGFASSHGALGFPGLKWTILTAVKASEANAVANSTRQTLWWVAGASFAILFLVAMWLGRSLSRPIFIALERIRLGTEEITAASGEVSTSGQNLAQGASRQAAALEETAATLEEMSSMTQRNAEGAQQAREITGRTRQIADTGAGRMHAMQGAMNDIATASQEITKILKTIDEIAFQTNILALNAAVEAARAGEHGAGFAVVAEEVRALAQRSATAARETADRIAAAVSKTQQGVQLTTEVSRQFVEIQQGIQQLETLVAGIATASTEQSQGIAQLNSAVADMDKVTQQTAATAEENAASAEELSGQAHLLTGTVGHLFTIIGGRRRNDRKGRGGDVRTGGRRSHDHATTVTEPRPAPASRALPAAVSASDSHFRNF